MAEKEFQILRGQRYPSETFKESAPPSWLLGGRPGSTMDNRWFYENHVLTLSVGENISTDFTTIKRIA